MPQKVVTVKFRRQVQRENDKRITQEEQLAAACTVYPYEAARLLGARQKGNLNEVPDHEWFTQTFSFSGQTLKDYILSHEGLANALLVRSYDNRGVPSAYMEEAPGGYSVGWFNHAKTQQQFHSRIEDAATDFVLMFWRLSRWPSPSAS